MTSTLDSKTLYLDDIAEDFEAVETQWDDWEDEAYTREIKVYGVIKRWKLFCHEKGVKWADSAANHFETKQTDGDIVALVIDMGSVDGGKLHSVSSTDVVILNVNVTYSTQKSGADYREFVVTVQASTSAGTGGASSCSALLTHADSFTLTKDNESVTVNHGKGEAPDFIAITPLDDLDGRDWYIDWSTVSSTQFTFYINNADPFNDHSFRYAV